ncbi:hypothetical protein AUJ68_03600 [Candidatus Woesearchaeota archaeon CG1_02_57_44]|nr:MAG: hypothetical protein AUJ68_03600 [Candidatus Woesearchaeota archaeon CG1_02_57_44]
MARAAPSTSRSASRTKASPVQRTSTSPKREPHKELTAWTHTALIVPLVAAFAWFVSLTSNPVINPSSMVMASPSQRESIILTVFVFIVSYSLFLLIFYAFVLKRRYFSAAPVAVGAGSGYMPMSGSAGKAKVSARKAKTKKK